MIIYTGNYESCKAGNLISISGDRGKSVNFKGKVMSELAPKRKFWEIWHDNIGKISEQDNIRYYIIEYYKQVLSKVDIEQLFENEKAPILLCYEESSDFCHRHILAEYINIKYGIEVYEIEINEKLEIIQKQRPRYIREILEEVMEKVSF